MSAPTARKGWPLLAIVVLFALPYLASALLLAGWFDPARFGTSRAGMLVRAPLRVPELSISNAETEPRMDWTLGVFAAACADTCAQRLFLSGQIKRALGGDGHRLDRLLLSADAPPAQAPRHLRDTPATALLAALASANRGEGEGYFIADSQGRVVLVYAADTSAKALIDDLRRLLQQSG